MEKELKLFLVEVISDLYSRLMEKNNFQSMDSIEKTSIKDWTNFTVESVFKKMLKLLLFALYLGRGLCSEIPADSPVCDLQCRSVRFIDNFIDKLSDDSIEVSDGVKFVKTEPGDVGSGAGRSVRDSLLTRFKRFLSSYELQVKIPDLLPRKQDVTSALHSAIGYLNELQSGEGEIFRPNVSFSFPSAFDVFLLLIERESGRLIFQFERQSFHVENKLF